MHARRIPFAAKALLGGITLGVFAVLADPAAAACTNRVKAAGAGATRSEARTAAIVAWQQKVANTINDLYSDWNYAREKTSDARLVAGKHFVSVSGRPCNS